VGYIKTRVRELAEKKGLDPAKLARRSDLGYATVVGIWFDQTKNPGVITLQKIANALGVDLKDLIIEEEETQVLAAI
jgi:transcriptional regulator with XRE-family HTH domain